MTVSSGAASGQATSAGLSVKTLAEVLVGQEQGGKEVHRMVSAERVRPGDEVIYTLEIRNTTARPIDAPVVVTAVPSHTVYLADSATGPGAQTSFSADGGRHFGTPQQLEPLPAREYTHIQWKLKNTLAVNSVAFARFRARMK